MKWRILVSGKMDPYMNMALDEAIYLRVTRGISPPTIRFYDWLPPSFSYGYNQDVERELDLGLLKKSAYGFVRRPTGGRMVLHEEEVTYSVISPLCESMAGSIHDTYLRIGEALVTGLSNLQIEAEMARGKLSLQEQKRSANPCFTSSSRSELTYKRKKLVGSAQTRNSKAFLQHGSILKSYNQKKVAEYIPAITEDERLRIATLLDKRTIALETILARRLSFEEVVDKLLDGFKKAWTNETFDGPEEPSVEEIDVAQELVYKKYSSDEWNINLKKKTKRV